MLATQNPIELEGTYPLPEAQLDRFLFNILLDYLTADQELQVVDLTTTTHVAHADSITTAEEILDFQQLVRMTPIAETVSKYAIDLVRATRMKDPNAPEVVKKYVNYGGSVRAAQFLVLGGEGPGADERPLSRELRGHPRALYSDPAPSHSAELPRGIRPSDAGRHSDSGAPVETRTKRVKPKTCHHRRGRGKPSFRAATVRERPNPQCSSNSWIPPYSPPSRLSTSSRRRWWMASSRVSTAPRNSVSARSSPNTSNTSPGDDLRHIDWNVFARSERLYLKRFKGETNMQLLILLDASASMTYGSGKVRQAGLRALRRRFARLPVVAAARCHRA